MDHSTDQTESSTPLASANTVLIRGMDLHVFNAAKEGQTDVLKGRHDLDQILTPTKNTVLHIYIAFASNPNYVEPEEETLRPPSVVKEILQMCPALLSQKNESGETALHIAARHGRVDIVKLLIEIAKAGCREDLENGSSSSAVEAWQMLIRETNKEKDTALHFAVRFQHFPVVEILTSEDPDFSDSANDAGETPLYLAAERGYKALFSEIRRTCKHPTYQGPNGRTALHAAVINGDEKMTEEILNKKKDLAIVADEKEGKRFDGHALTIVADEKGWTPLHYVAFYGHASIVTQLLEANRCSAYMGDEADKKTALHIAASKGHVDVMKELISRCPDCCELVDQKRRNALHYALENHQSRITNIVRKDPWLSNVLLNAKDVDGNTPLHLLNVPHYSRIPLNIQILIGDKRVDKMAFNKKNMNALDVIKAKCDLIYKMYLGNESSGHRILSENDNDDQKSEYDNDDQKLKKNEGGDDTKNIRESHLIVATLVATVTFAAGVTMPGGYYQASDQVNGMSNVSQQNVTAPAPALAPSNGPTPGYAVLTNDRAFRWFFLFNMMALCLSTFSVLTHLFIVRLPEAEVRFKLLGRFMIRITTVSVCLMMCAFISCTYAVFGDSPPLAHSSLLLGTYLFCLVVYARFFIDKLENFFTLSLQLNRWSAKIKRRCHIDWD